MQISKQLVQNFLKLSGSQKLQIAYWNEKLDTMLSQANASQNSRQMIDNIHNDFQPFAFIMTERFDNTQKINLTIISGMRVKKNVEKRQHKIKQTDYRLVFKETIKVENKEKIELSWNLHSQSYSVIDKQQIYK